MKPSVNTWKAKSRSAFTPSTPRRSAANGLPSTPITRMRWKTCRICIHDLASRLGVPVKGTGLADGIEVFPKHDAIGASEFGNAIRGRLGIHRGTNRRFWFYGANYSLEAQILTPQRLPLATRQRFVGDATSRPGSVLYYGS